MLVQLSRDMLSSAHMLAMNAKHLLDVIDKIRMNYRHVNMLNLCVSHSNNSSNFKNELVYVGSNSYVFCQSRLKGA